MFRWRSEGSSGIRATRAYARVAGHFGWMDWLTEWLHEDMKCMERGRVPNAGSSDTTMDQAMSTPRRALVKTWQTVYTNAASTYRVLPAPRVFTHTWLKNSGVGQQTLQWVSRTGWRAENAAPV